MHFIEVSQTARLVFSGSLLFVIAYQLWIALARRSEPALYVTAGWATAALVMMIGRAVQHATNDGATVILGSKLFHTGLLALVPIGLLLMHQVMEAPWGRFFYACTVASVGAIVLVWTGDLIISSHARQFQTLAGPIMGPAPAPLGPLAIPAIVGAGLYLLYIARRGRTDLPWHRRLSLYAIVCVFLPTLVNDALLFADRLVTVELIGIGLFAVTVTVNVEIFARAGQLFSGLERAVDERTAQLRARERELSRILAFRRRILDAIPDAVCVLEGAHLDYVNEAGTRLFGKTLDELAGSAFVSHVVPSQAADAERCLAAIAESSLPSRPAELRFIGAEGVEREGEVAGLMLDLDNGRRTLVTIRDVTERTRLMARLHVADRLASVGTLAAGVAHEINNPLAFVVGNLGLMKRALESQRDALSSSIDRHDFSLLVDECVVGAERIGRIVKDLHPFARADDTAAVLDVSTVLVQALKMAMVTIRHRATVTTAYGAAPLVAASPGQLAQVFLNLLINASQAIPDDRGAHTIQVSTATGADGWAVIEIADSGIGIDPGIAATVFDPFVTTKPVGSGTGLGLFICHEIVSALGGEISLRPGERRGTIAQVRLPPAAGVPAPQGIARPEVPVASLANLRVLIADDEDIALRVLRRQLAGCAVTTVTGGAAAIACLEAGTFDVILCDLAMPGCTGAEVWEAARHLGHADRFVLMTGGATTDALRTFVERTHVPCLLKPIALGDLHATIAAVVARAEAPDESQA